MKAIDKPIFIFYIPVDRSDNSYMTEVIIPSLTPSLLIDSITNSRSKKFEVSSISSASGKFSDRGEGTSSYALSTYDGGSNAITLAICIPAYYVFEDVVDNFMNLIGYYLAIYDAIALSEHFIYRKGFKGYNIEDYDDKTKINPGFAGAFSFCCGVAGVVLGMNQTWYSGVIARLIGDFGGDIGFELAAGFAFIAYNCTRPIEKKYYGR